MIEADRIASKLRAAGMPCIADGTFTDVAGIAFLLGKKPDTVRKWRDEGRGPPCFFAGRWLYDIEELAKWLAEGGSKRQKAA